MSREQALKAANLIADDFTVGFCDHRMVELFADRIEEVYNDLAGEITLRDYFAAKAMQGLCVVDNIHFVDLDITAEQSYLIADAMLKERGKS
jgi:hypothetical protein